MLFEYLLYVLFRGIIGKAAHRHTFRQSHVSTCKRKVKLVRNFNCVLAHNLIKIAEAHNDDYLRIDFLRVKVLPVNRADRVIFLCTFFLLCNFLLLDGCIGYDRFVRYRFFFGVVYDLYFRLLILVCLFYLLR